MKKAPQQAHTRSFKKQQQQQQQKKKKKKKKQGHR